MRIQVNAHQWAWDARYAGPDGKFNTADDIVTLNDMRVPMGVAGDPATGGHATSCTASRCPTSG